MLLFVECCRRGGITFRGTHESINLKEDTEEYFFVLAKRRCRAGEAKLAYRAYEAAILSCFHQGRFYISFNSRLVSSRIPFQCLLLYRNNDRDNNRILNDKIMTAYGSTALALVSAIVGSKRKKNAEERDLMSV